MIFGHWNILVVDDEPDVLTVTKMALRRLTVYGLPLKLTTCSSKAEAVEYFQQPESWLTAAAIIDVVMESETAGLELCQYVREEIGNRLVPLLIRTGQAGQTPAREVVDRYDISGYVHKVDATPDRLYSIVKPAIRQWYYGHATGGLDQALRDHLAGVARVVGLTPPDRLFAAVLEQTRLLMEGTQSSGVSRSVLNSSGIFELGESDAFAGTGEFRNREEALAKIAELERGAMANRLSNGGQWMHQDGRTMFTTGTSQKGTRLRWIYSSHGPPPDFLVASRMNFLASIHAIWGLAHAISSSGIALESARREMAEVFENISQAILTIDEDLLVAREYSRFSEEVFGRSALSGTYYPSLIAAEPEESPARDELIDQLKLVFHNPTLKWTQAQKMLQSLYSVDRPDGSRADVAVGYEPIREDGRIKRIMVLIQDQTTQRELQRSLEAKEREMIENVDHIAELARVDPELYEAIFEEASEILAAASKSLHTVRSSENPSSVIDSMFRDMHTLKGNAMAHGMLRIAAKAHWVEESFSELRNLGSKVSDEVLAEATRKVRELDELLTRIQEIATTVLARPEHSGRELTPPAKRSKRVEVSHEQLENLIEWSEGSFADQPHSEELLERLRSLMLVPLAKLYDRLPKMVAELGEALAKEVTTDLDDPDIRVTPAAFEALSTVLIHLVRNAIDHGIESPPERSAANKETQGTISLRSIFENDAITIEIRDDGRGIDVVQLIKKAGEQGLIPTDRPIKTTDALRLIFAPGLLTAQEVTTTSGRGVGMDIIESLIVDLGGTIDVETKIGRGTQFRISLPRSASMPSPSP